ncbi:MAG: MlaD family protein [Nitrospirota bacterium]|nr:MlaD family protein [Nitrospirota bacterium]
MSYLKEEIKAGVTIFTAFVVLSAFVILIGGSRLFEKVDTYSMKVMNSAGIDVGSQVRLGGVPVGKVTAIIPPAAPGEAVTINLGVKQGTVIFKGTRASIAQAGLVSDNYILLAIDTTTSGQFKPGDIIPTEPQVQMATLMARTDSIMQSVDSLTKNMNAILSDKNVEEVGKILESTNAAIASGSSNMEKVAMALKGTTAKLELVLGEVEGFIRENKGEVSPLLKRAREEIDRAGEMLKAFEETAKSANATIRNADKAIDHQSENMDDLLTTLGRTTEDIRDALDEMKAKPWSFIYKEEKGREE